MVNKTRRFPIFAEIMRHLIIPLLVIAILLDCYSRWNYQEISDFFYYVGECAVYTLWVLAFWTYAKFPPSEIQRKVIILILITWIPFCLNALWRQASGVGHLNSDVDFYSGILSGIFVTAQSCVWWYKAKRSK